MTGRQATRSPNIWEHPDVYEVENAAFDPDGVVETAMREIHDWTGAHVLDLGCGSGYHLPRFAAAARRVTGVEPHPPLLEAARRRIARLGGDAGGRVRVVPGLAQQIPLPDSGVDVAHARWAYFFGPGCDPGLAELARVLRPGGTAFVLDNDATRSTFGRWFRRQWPAYDPLSVERFWARRGWSRRALLARWVMGTRADLEAVARIELSAQVADAVLAEHTGLEVDYAVNLWWRTH